jgi:Beta-galactosidase
MVSASTCPRPATHGWSRCISRACVALAAALSALLLVVSPAHAMEPPFGVFSLTPAGKPVKAEILTHPAVAGVSIRQPWPAVQPAEGVYDWSYLDQQVARSAAAGKQILLRVVAGGEETPPWVVAAGVHTVTFVDKNRYHATYQQPLTIPVFWDPMFLQHKTQLIRAMGQQFSAHPHLVVVSASCANATSDDWHVPHTSADVANWLAAGYTSAQLIAACQAILDTTMTAFPNQYVLLAVGRNGTTLDPDPDYVARQVVAYARASYPGRLMVQKNALSADTPDPTLLPSLGAWQIVFDHPPDVAGQMVWRVTDDATCRMNGGVTPCDPATMLHEAVTLGAAYGMRYQEIYQKDLLNPALAAVISEAAAWLAP